MGFSNKIPCPSGPFGRLYTDAMKQFATITVIGRDKTGVIARVTAFLFEQGANIEALEEQVTRGQFSMTIQASWKTGLAGPRDVRDGLRKAGLDVAATGVSPPPN